MTPIEELRTTADGLRGLARKALLDAKAIQGRCDAEHRDVSVAEHLKLDALLQKRDEYERELTSVQFELDVAERTEGLDAASQRPAYAGVIRNSTPYHSMPLHDAAAPIGRTFFAMFPQAKASSAIREFSDLGDFARAVYEHNPRLFNAASGMGESVGADGGFFLPTAMYANLMDNSLQQEAIRPGATIIPMASLQVSIPQFDLSNRSTGIATLEGKVTGEGSTAATQKAKTRSIDLVAKKIVVLVPTTTELLQDAPQLFGGLLQTAMQDALGQTLDTWFISGSGAAVPLGIMNAPCLVSVAKDTSQVAATLTPTNIAGMVARLAPGSWARSRWIVSPSALAQLFTLATITKNVAGTENVSGHAPEFFNVLPDGKFSLCGRPLVVSDRCAALGTKGDVLLADLSAYLIGIRQDAVLLVDTSIGFKESEVWFKLVCRVDGQPAQASPITPRVGTATLSPFVTLDTRA